ncbi:hypothetical protein [Roseovarius indicus]|uniref:hypothetical protein n=1 Tax=Roseovarius indicus TaxID=540747 RepID=UPI0032ED757E
MPRFLMALLLCCALPVAAPAQGLGKENCSATKQILSVAIKGRKAGLTARSLKSQLTTGRAAVAEKYRPTVATLVDLVFTLDQVSLTEKTATDYETECLNYKP